METASGTINITTDAVNTQLSVTGKTPQSGSWQAVIFFWGGRSETTDQSSETDIKPGFGVALSSSNRWALTSQSDHSPTTMATDNYQTDAACIADLTVAGAVDGLADFVSFNSDGFTLIIDDAFAAALEVSYVLIAGLDNVAAGFFQLAAATGDSDYTGLTGFTPDAALFGTIFNTAAPPGAAAHAYLSLGAATASAQYVLSVYSQDAAGTSITSSYCRSGEIMARGQTNNTTIDSRASLTSFLSTGFRINRTTTTTQYRVAYFAWKGGQTALGDFLTATNTTAFTEVHGLGNTVSPKAAIFFSANRAASTAGAATANYEWSLGAATQGLTQSAHYARDKDASNNADCFCAVEHDNVYINGSSAATQAIEGAGKVNAFNTNSMALQMSVADPAQSFVWYIALGDAAGAASPSLTPPEGQLRIGLRSYGINASTYDIGLTGYTLGSAGGATNITPNVGSLALIGTTPVEQFEFKLSPAVGGLTLGPVTAQRSEGTLRSPSVASLLFAGNAPPINRGIVPSAATLTAAGVAPNISTSAGTSITPAGGSMTAAGTTAAVSRSSAPTAGSLILAGQAPTVIAGAGTMITVPSGTLRFGLRSYGIAASAGQIASTGYAPTLQIPVSITITPNAGELFFGLEGSVAAAGALSLTGYVPTVAVSGGAAIQPATGSLTLAGIAPTAGAGVLRQPLVGGLTLASTASNISKSIAPSAGGLTLAGIQGSISRSITPAAGILALAGLQPTIQTSANVALTPAAGSLLAQGQPPNVSTTSGAVIFPATGALSLIGQTPTVQSTANAFITPNAASLNFAGQLAAVQSTANAVRTPIQGSLTITGYNATFAGALLPTTGSLAIAGLQPSLSRSIAASTGTLTTQGFQPVQDTARIASAGTIAILGTAPLALLAITPSSGSLTLTGRQAAQGLITTIPSGSLTLQGQAPTAQSTTNVFITPAPSSLVFTTYQITTGGQLRPPAGSLVLNGAAANVSQSIAPATGSLALSGQQVTAALALVPSRASLTLASTAPSVTQGALIQPAAGQLIISPNAANVSVSIAPSSGSLTVTPEPVGVGIVIRPSLGSLSLQSQPAVASQGRVIVAAGGALAVVGQTPEFRSTLTPASGQLGLTGYPPGKQFASPDLIPSTGALTIASVAPSVSKFLTVSRGSLSLQGIAPTVFKTLVTGDILHPVDVRMKGSGPTVVRIEGSDPTDIKLERIEPTKIRLVA